VIRADQAFSRATTRQIDAGYSVTEKTEGSRLYRKANEKVSGLYSRLEGTYEGPVGKKRWARTDFKEAIK